MTDKELFQVSGLKKYFDQSQGIIDRYLNDTDQVKAINGVSFAVERGETVGVVGESGCGKSTLARCLINLENPTDGEIKYKGKKFEKFDSGEMDSFRKEVQMVFQDPASSLNRRKTISQTIKAPMEIHGIYENSRDERVRELLERVGLSPDYANRYPHEFSGGQRQRVGIARALSVDPEVLILDEPVSALDVSIQAQILNLLKDLQDDLDLTFVVISHDLSVIEYMCNRVAVMYLGEFMEIANSDVLFSNPQHPYTKALLDALPQPVPELARKRKTLEGNVPSPINPPSGCVFHTRCPLATEECSESRNDPELNSIDQSDENHKVACIHVDEVTNDNLKVDSNIGNDGNYEVENFNS
ncbi:ABC transporter ATP-binding protein [Halococcus thailandensis]|nr:dipeptide ABC transporter ATP-binding protein [Halococcus thailandensis]